MTDFKRKDAEKRHEALKSERASFLTDYQEISRFLLARNGRYFTQDRNKGGRRRNSIIDATGTRALKTLSAGMMAGMTSPARPWLRFQTRDKALNKFPSVRQWLESAAETVLNIFAKGNTYRALQDIYMEDGAFGTAATVVLDDYQDVMRCYSLTAGEYCIAQNWRGEVDTLYREFDKTVSEVVKEFGIEACSDTVKTLYNRGTLDAWVTLVQVIEPRDEWDWSRHDNTSMPWRSVYFEKGQNRDKVLRESGYEQFPALVSRWQCNGGDIYGDSPGMEALGFIKQLQQEQLRKAMGIDRLTNPPVGLPMSMKNREVDSLPGGITYLDANAQGPRNLFDVRIDLNHLLADINDVRQGINSAFFADLFLMISNSAMDPNRTATEIAALQEEKMLMLGPVIERMTDELLNPLVTGCFNRALKAGLFPPLPPELDNQPVEVEYVSILAQAQRSIGTNAIDRFTGNIGVLAQMKPEILDRFDADQWVDVYSDRLGVDPRLIVPAQTAALIRKQRAEAQAKAQAAQQANVQADTAQKLGAAPTQGGGSNALNDLLGSLQGYNFPAAQFTE